MYALRSSMALPSHYPRFARCETPQVEVIVTNTTIRKITLGGDTVTIARLASSPEVALGLHDNPGCTDARLSLSHILQSRRRLTVPLNPKLKLLFRLPSSGMASMITLLACLSFLSGMHIY